jgi:hypothetical protein
MVSFFAIAAVELASGQRLVEQAASPAGAAGAAALTLAVTAASLAPALTGRVPATRVFPSTDDSVPDGPLPYFWTALAETINGRRVRDWCGLLPNQQRCWCLSVVG